MDAKTILDREFLEIRAKLLEVAAALDRIDRADGDVSEDRRRAQIGKAIEIIAAQPDPARRAEQIQLLFSRPYDENWLAEFELVSRT